MSQRRMVQAGLGLAIIVIWALVAAQLFDAAGPVEADHRSREFTTTQGAATLNRQDFRYTQGGRDPFLYGSAPKPASPRPDPELQREDSMATATSLEFLGTVDGIAILNVDGEPHVLRQDQTVDGLRLSHVEPDSLTLNANGRLIGLALGRRGQKE